MKPLPSYLVRLVHTHAHAHTLFLLPMPLHPNAQGNLSRCQLRRERSLILHLPSNTLGGVIKFNLIKWSGRQTKTITQTVYAHRKEPHPQELALFSHNIRCGFQPLNICSSKVRCVLTQNQQLCFQMVQRTTTKLSVLLPMNAIKSRLYIHISSNSLRPKKKSAISQTINKITQESPNKNNKHLKYTQMKLKDLFFTL